MTDEIHPKAKERIDVLMNSASYYTGAARNLEEPIQNTRDNRGHNLANAASARKDKMQGRNFQIRPEGTALVREETDEEEKWIAAADRELADQRKLQKQQKELYGFAASSSKPAKLATKYLSKLPPSIELLFEDRKVSKPKGASDAEALVQSASYIADTTKLYKTTSRAPKTVEEAKALWREQVRRNAEKGAPDFATLFSPSGKEARFHSFFVDLIPRPDAFLLNVWLHEEALIEKGDREIEALASLEGGALSAQQRTAKLADIEATIFDLESDYETLWFSLASQGMFIPRREGVTDARPVLGLSRDMPKIKIELN